MTEGQASLSTIVAFVYVTAAGFTSCCLRDRNDSSFASRHAVAIGALFPVAILVSVILAVLDLGSLLHESRVAQLDRQRAELERAEHSLRAAERL